MRGTTWNAFLGIRSFDTLRSRDVRVIACRSTALALVIPAGPGMAAPNRAAVGPANTQPPVVSGTPETKESSRRYERDVERNNAAFVQLPVAPL